MGIEVKIMIFSHRLETPQVGIGDTLLILPHLLGTKLVILGTHQLRSLARRGGGAARHRQPLRRHVRRRRHLPRRPRGVREGHRGGVPPDAGRPRPRRSSIACCFIAPLPASAIVHRAALLESVLVVSLRHRKRFHSPGVFPPHPLRRRGGPHNH